MKKTTPNSKHFSQFRNTRVANNSCAEARFGHPVVPATESSQKRYDEHNDNGHKTNQVLV
jgi:hypothetical protein